MKSFFISVVVGLALTLTSSFAYAEGTLAEGFAAYQAQDYDKAYEILLPHANTYATQGFIKAQWLVGNLYLGGNGVEKSVPKGWVWHQKAIKNAYDVKNYALIQKIIQPYLDNNLIEGKIEYAKLLSRAGNAEQRKEADAFIEKAAKAGNAMAQYEMSKLGSGFTDNIERYRYKVKWLKLSADQGYAPAQIAYGAKFSVGGPSVTQKIFPKEALADWPDGDDARRQWKKDQRLKWALKAAAGGGMYGEYAAAIAYRNNGDRENAMVYFARAAKLGHFKAELEQAKGYDAGWGVKQDQQRAANLYQDIVDRVGVNSILIDNDWKNVNAGAQSKLNALTKKTGIIPKKP